MRVVHYMGMSSTKYGGLEKFMVALAKEGAKRNIQFCFVYYDEPKSIDYVRDVENSGGEVKCFRMKHKLLQMIDFLYFIRKSRPDIVHFHFGIETNILAAIIRLCPQLRHIVLLRTLHCCMYSHERQIFSYSEFALKTKAIYLLGAVSKVYDKIIAVSDFVRKQWLSIFPESKNLVKIYFGCNAPELSTSKEIKTLKENLNIGSEKVLCSILFSSPIKGPDILINALPYIHNDFKLILIGLDDSAYTNELISLSRELGVYDRIIWVGISNNVSKYLEISDLYIQPSRTEALALATMEAASYSKPIIGSEAGGLPEIASLVFPIEDYRTLAILIDNVLSDKVLYEKLCLESYDKWKNRFNINIGVSDYLAIYGEFNEPIV